MAVLVHGVFLVQRTLAVWGMAPSVCSGSIAEESHPSLQKGSTAGVVVQGQVKLVLPGLCSPDGFCLTSLPSVTAVQSSGVLPLLLHCVWWEEGAVLLCRDQGWRRISICSGKDKCY